MSLISPITSLFVALIAKLQELRSPKVTLPDGWDQFLGEPELWEATKCGEEFGKAADVECTYIKYRIDGLSPQAALTETLRDWDCI